MLYISSPALLLPRFLHEALKLHSMYVTCVWVTKGGRSANKFRIRKFVDLNYFLSFDLQIQDLKPLQVSKEYFYSLKNIAYHALIQICTKLLLEKDDFSGYFEI